MRKISKSLILIGLFAPWGVHALGIGDIVLHSALNETLNAEIPLITSDAEDLSNIRVTLATTEAFARAHIERNYLLTRLRFNPKKKPDGSLVINVTSDVVIREPFLDFMVEIYWPEGRLLREFTVLLDPPDNVPLANLPDQYSPETDNYAYPEGERIPRQSATVRGAPRRSARNVTGSAAPAPRQEASEINVTGSQYGPVESNETLWSIAQQFQSSAIGQRKMLLALYKANPKAFFKPNVNALKAGVTLIIPDQASVMLLTGTAGNSQDPHNADGINANAKSPAEPIADSGVNKTPETRGQLKLLASAERKPQTVGAPTDKQGKIDKSKEDLALELADTARQENENFRQRLSDLEQQLSAMQKLLVLKDEQVAALQAQRTPPTKEASLTPAPGTGTAAPASANPAKTAPAAVAINELSKTHAEAPIAETRLAPPPTPTQTPDARQAPTLPPRPSETAPSKPQPSVAGNPPAQSKSINPTETNKEDGFLSGVLGQTSYVYYLLGGATGLLLLALFWVFKRRHSVIAENPESILTLNNEKSKNTLQHNPATEPANVTQNVSEVSTVFRSSFLSEFTPSDFDALGSEMTEVDPISEADVYLAYGRYKQAEDLILGAIGQNPERDDCRLKLLEIHYATENASSFEKCAQELAPTHKETKPDFWAKVVEMGRELCPINPLFSGDKVLSQNEPMQDPLPAAQAQVHTGEEDVYLFQQDDGLESYDYPITPPAPEKPIEVSVKNSPPLTDHDVVPTLHQPSKEGELGKTKETGSKQSDGENLILYDPTDIINKEDEIEIPFVSLEASVAKLSPYAKTDFLQSGLEDITPNSREEKPPANLSSSKKQVDRDELGLDFHIYETNISPSEEFEDIKIKLDLAKAYIDLGDADSARSILLEVIELGQSELVEEANLLLASLGKQE